MKIGQYLFVFLITFLLFSCTGKKAVDRAYDRADDMYDKAMDDSERMYDKAMDDAEDLMREYGY